MHQPSIEPRARGERVARILAVAAALACEGDLEAVQMRLVAERADVAMGTVYRYFPSKVHLMVAVLVDELETAVARERVAEVTGATEFVRVMTLVDRSIRAREEVPRLHAAMLRAFVLGGEASPPESARVTELVREIIAQAIRPGASPSPMDVEVATVLGDVWLSATVGWVAGRLSPQDVYAKMERAARLLLGE